MRIETTSYEWTHGKQPAGFGHWMFVTRTSSGFRNFRFTGTFAEARRAVSKWAKAQGVFEVKVQS